MKADLTHINLLFGWLWLWLGFLSGMVLGLFFHHENWLGGYGSLRRRMYRLGHISFFGLGVVNLLFGLTIPDPLRLATVGVIASLMLVIGGITMPLCCGIMAHFPKAHLMFTLPVGCLILGGGLTLWIVSGGAIHFSSLNSLPTHSPS